MHRARAPRSNRDGGRLRPCPRHGAITAATISDCRDADAGQLMPVPAWNHPRWLLLLLLLLLLGPAGAGVPLESCTPAGAGVCGRPDEPLLLADGADGEGGAGGGTAVMRGMHLLHLLPSAALPHMGAAACPQFEVQLYADGRRSFAAPQPVTVQCASNLSAVAELILKPLVAAARAAHPDVPPAGSVARLELDARPAGFDRWAFYTPLGEPVKTVAGLLRCTRALAFEGGLFVWPGVEVGFRRHVPVLRPEDAYMTDEGGGGRLFGGGGGVTLVTYSLLPLVFVVDPLLTDEECAYVINETTPLLEVSDISHFDRDRGLPATKWRRSMQARLANDRCGRKRRHWSQLRLHDSDLSAASHCLWRAFRCC